MITKEAIEALQPFADAVFNDNGDMTVDLSFAKADDFIKAYFVHKRLSTLPIAVEGKVKALEWHRDEGGYWRRWAAATPFGTYSVWRDGGVYYGGFFICHCENDEAAKAAAQVDYERRILSALVSSPGKDGGQEVGADYDAIMRDALVAADSEYAIGPDETAFKRAIEAAVNWSFLALSDAQPVSTALVERLMKALEPFCKHYEPWMERWDDQKASSTFSRHTFGDLREALAAINEARSALSASTSREGDDA